MTKVTPKRRKKPDKRFKKYVAMNDARRKRALELIESGEFIVDVAESIGVSRQTLYREKWKNKAFAEAWDQAEVVGHQIQASLTEQEMDFRGRIGWLEPKFFEGRICGFVKKYSDALLLARMKRLDPDNYGDKTKLELDANVNTGGAVVVPGQLTPETWQETIDQYDRLGPPPFDIEDDDEEFAIEGDD